MTWLGRKEWKNPEGSCGRPALFRAALIAGAQSQIKTHHGWMRNRVGGESVRHSLADCSLLVLSFCSAWGRDTKRLCSDCRRGGLRGLWGGWGGWDEERRHRHTTVRETERAGGKHRTGGGGVQERKEDREITWLVWLGGRRAEQVGHEGVDSTSLLHCRLRSEVLL